MVTPFTIAATLLLLGGAVGIGWVLKPLFTRVREEAADPDPPDIDYPDRLGNLLELMTTDDDSEVPWTRSAPLLSGARIPGPFQPSDAFFAVVSDNHAYVLGMNAMLEAMEPTDAQVLRGRSLGRPFHAVRLEDELFLDLVGVARFAPIVLAELSSHTNSTDLRLYTGVDDLIAKTGVRRDRVILVAPWLVVDHPQRMVPEGDGAREFTVQLEGHALRVEAWMPSVQDGVRSGVPVWAARVEYREHQESSLLEQAAVDGLDGEWASPTWQWTADELMELAGIGERLGQEDVDPLPLVLDAFADRRMPLADPSDEQGVLVAAAVLNWAGVMVRKSGMPKRALGFFDAGLQICGDGHEDNRADLHYNRGFARLHAASLFLESTGHERLKNLRFPEHVDPDVLDAALRDFTISTGLNPNDPDAWSQIALTQQLRGNRKAASEAWLQAATRSRDEFVKQTLLANAEAFTSAPRD